MHWVLQEATMQHVHHSRLRSLFRLVILLIIVALLARALAGIAPLHAQEADPRRPHPPVPPPIPPITMPAPPAQIVIARHAVDAAIEGQLAQVQVTQVLRNLSGSVAEGVYIFPLPADAAVNDFQMSVDGEVLEGRLLDRDEARRIYEQIVRSQRDPALLEYLDRGLFQTSIFPIPPGETRTVELTYTHLVERSDGLHHFNYPLHMPHLRGATAQEIDVRVVLSDLPGLRTIYSPNYPITVERLADDEAVITYSAAADQPASDFDLYFGADQQAVGLDLLSYRPAGEDGYFVLLAAPSFETASDEIVARDIVVVLDVSGSMQGKKIEQAQDAVRYIVEQLNPEDRFNLIAFSTGVTLWKKELQAVDVKSTNDALRWIDDVRAAGSTDINRALLEALAQLDERGATQPATILFLTDGQPTQGEMDTDAIIRNAMGNLPAARAPRLFTFGVGYDVNTDLLDMLAADLRGSSQYVTPDEPIDEAVSAFFAQVSTPVLAEIAIDFGDVGIDNLHPYPLPDLFAGRQLVVAGRYKEGGAVEVTLAGQVNGKEIVYIYPERQLVEHGGEPFVAQLWATREIGHLLAQIRRSGPDPELVQAVTELSLRYGIVTPYTSYLVLEPALLDMPAGAPVREGDAFRILPSAEEMREQAASAADAMYAAPASGEAAVAASQARIDLLQADRVSQTSAEMRYVAGRAFVLRAYVTAADGSRLPLWVDTSYDEAMATTTIEFGSEAYAELLDDSEMARWLAISSELIVVTDEGSAVRITTLTAEE
jgi:Ca-activated chloride channel family protein